MATKTTNISVVAAGIVLVLIVIGTPVPAQAQSQQIILSDVVIDAELNQNCTTIISIEAEINNTGLIDLSYIDIRVDVRSLNVTTSLIDGVHAETALFPEERYSVIRVFSPSSIQPNISRHLSLILSTGELQQRQDPNPTGPLCTNHFIYYIRPLSEMRGLTFKTHLPAHATLEADAAAPLFPRPARNHTDGNRMVFVWETSVLYPGQELAYIVKYQLPTGLIQTEAQAPDFMLLVVLAAFLGAVSVLIIERLPKTIRQLRTKRESTVSVVSTQEQQVLSLLEKKGGSCLQREIYEELNMSQSMASMLLNSLEERGLIKRFRDGRENVVHKMEP